MGLSIGFVKISRSILKWRWYKKPYTKCLFLHLLLTANISDSYYENIAVKRGQVVTGRKQLSEELGLSEQSVRTALKHLTSTNEISVESNRRYSLITINNYDKYQCNNQPSINQLLTNNQPTTNQQLTNDQPHKKNNKEEKEYKEEGNIDPAEVIGLFKKICVSFPKPVLYRRLAKAISSCEVKDFKRLFEKSEQSDFLSGRGGKWCCDMEWVINHAGKIMSGAYDNRKPLVKNTNSSYDIEELERIV